MRKVPISGPTRILVVDDHPLVREGLQMLIAHYPEFQVCGEAEDETTAVRMVGEMRPDVMVVDISLKQGSGIELIKRVRSRYPEVRMIVASMHDEGLFAERVLHAGAMGFVSKQEGSSKIIDAIRSVLEGNVYFSSEVSNRLLIGMSGRSPLNSGSPIERLTDRELVVFELLGKGHTVREIGKKLYLSPKTVERHRENIKTKLNVETAADVLRHATQWVLENK